MSKKTTTKKDDKQVEKPVPKELVAALQNLYNAASMARLTAQEHDTIKKNVGDILAALKR